MDVRTLESGQEAPAVMASLHAEGAQVVIGAYASDLSIAASAAAADAGLVYWEAGAVADRLTGRGLPMVFRVGASGANLGSNSARFATSQLASLLGKQPGSLRLAIVAANDDYATSVAAAATREAAVAGAPIVLHATYDLTLPRWPQLMARLAAARPDVIILASHIPDGISFRRAMLAAPHRRVPTRRAEQRGTRELRSAGARLDASRRCLPRLVTG
ncbi:MAG: amino acid ABC transporter substrate-binding protein [Chloroflexi bacterium]|nr:MAG: amino acid ABC transporter substrate-binding protein [Chloroflexota bacterium]